MKEGRSEKSRTAEIAVWVIPLLLLSSFYVLSVGPATQLVVRLSARPGPDNEQPWQVFRVVYGPLFTVAKATATDNLLSDYISRWD
jgi:hypothetical protein